MLCISVRTSLISLAFALAEPSALCDVIYKRLSAKGCSVGGTTSTIPFAALSFSDQRDQVLGCTIPSSSDQLLLALIVRPLYV